LNGTKEGGWRNAEEETGSGTYRRGREKKADDMALYEEQTKRLTPYKENERYIRRRKTKSRWN
jgi:ketosteroid isomerase-like protein